MTEEQRKKYEDAAKRYSDQMPHGKIREFAEFDFLRGSQFAHSLLEERIKEEYNKAIDEVDKILHNFTYHRPHAADQVKDIQYAIQKLRK